MIQNWFPKLKNTSEVFFFFFFNNPKTLEIMIDFYFLTMDQTFRSMLDVVLGFKLANNLFGQNRDNTIRNRLGACVCVCVCV